MKLEQKTNVFIEKFHMLSNGAGIVVGLSGGADSVALLEVLCEKREALGLRLAAVHVHHGIRPEAQQDAEFCRELCARKQVDFFCEYVDVPQMAKEQGLSLEEAGRKARYRMFEEYRNKLGFDKIAVAHHQNDQAETMLFQLFRGTGLRGLAGIAACRDYIIRPLLCVSREEIERYLQDKGLDFVTDATNFSDIYARNKIRHQILPAAGEISMGAVVHMSNTAGQLREVLDYMESQARNFLKDCGIQEIWQESEAEKGTGLSLPVTALGGQHIALQKMIVMEAIRLIQGSRKDITEKHIESILSVLDKEGEKMVHLPKGVQVTKSYDRLHFRKEIQIRETTAFEKLEIEPNQTYLLDDGTILETELIFYNKLENIPKNDCIKWFDYDKINSTLCLRTRMQGDFLTVSDNGARKTLQDYLVNEKVPKGIRDNIRVLADGSHIVWVMGKRISTHYKVSANTTRILQIRIGGKYLD